MPEKTTASVVFAFIAGCLLMFLSCTTDTISGGGTETGNAFAMGTIYNPDGSAAKNAVVRFIPADYNPHPGGLSKAAAAVDSTITNDSGQYTIDSLPADTFNVIASGDSGLSYQDSIIIEPDTTNRIPPGQLKKAGSISGVIRLGLTDDSRSVIILVFGTNTWAAPGDSIGNFKLANMAEGVYHVRIMTTTPDYSPLDLDMEIRAGVDSVMGDTIRLPFKGIPVVTGLRIEYDTLKQIVTLSWNAADMGLVQGYNVYRRHTDSTYSNIPLNATLITDTTFSDSSAVQDETYEYKVKALDMEGNEGMLSAGASVKVISAFKFISAIGDSSYDGAGGLNRPLGISVNSFGEIFIIDVGYGGARIVKYDSNYNFITSFDTLLNGQSVHVLNYPEGIDIDNNDHILIADKNAGKILKIDRQGALILAFNGISEDVTTDESNSIYFCSSGGMLPPLPKLRVTTMVLSGLYLFKYDSMGILLNQFEPTGFNGGRAICCDSAANIYIGQGQIVQKYSNQGILIREWLVGPTNSNVADLYIGDSLLFALNYTLGKVVVFTLEGTFQFSWGLRGQREGQFHTLEGICISRNDIYIADSGKRAVYVYRR